MMVNTQRVTINIIQLFKISIIITTNYVSESKKLYTILVILISA